MQPEQLRGLIVRLLDFKKYVPIFAPSSFIVIVFMYFEICSTSLADIRKGCFPLNHDCILQAFFKDGCGIQYQFFTCRSQDSGSLVSVLSQVFCITKVLAIPVDKFNS